MSLTLDGDESEIDWAMVNEQAGLDQRDSTGSKVTSHTKLELALDVYTDFDPEDAIQAGLDAGVLEPNYVEFPDGGRTLRGYIYTGPTKAGDTE